VTVPVWLLDVDGVLNATRPGWGAAPRRQMAYADGDAWPMRWAPALLDRIRTLVTAQVVEVRWCTTWCAWADQLERMWQLPPLGRAFEEKLNGGAASMAKLLAARTVLAEGRRLIWTDDMEVPDGGPLYDALVENGRALLIRPSENHGLQPEHMDLIEAFCAAVPEESC
jgi:hypothetical protein